MATGSETQITPPRVSLIDERTGAVSREWYRWFYSLFTTLGSGTGVVPVTSGGTGLSTIPTDGQLLIGNGTGYTLNTLGYGAGISVTNGAGTVVVANTGVLSNIAGTGISVSSATGDVTVANTGVLSWSGGTTGLTPATATTGAVTLAGTLGIANGGTNGTSTPTAGAVPYGTGTSYAFTAAGTAGQVLTSAGAGVPTWTTPTTGTVTSVGLAMPVQFTVTNSPVTSSGTLTAAFTTQSANSLFAGPTSGAGAVPTFRALTTADIPALPYGTGTVTSVGLSLPSIMTVSGSPVTSSGTLTGTLTTQAVNAIFAGPSSGAAAAPTFRALTTADIPALSYVSSVSGTTGRITSTGGLTPIIDLASGVITAGTTGSITAIPVITVDTYGRVTSITTAANPQGTVTSVAATVPSVLSISGSPITSSGTLAITYSGTALPVANGGTGITTTPTNGQIPIGNGTNYTAATITAGTNIAITNGAGSISVATSIPVPSVTVYASGSGTYTTPANTKYIVVEMVGGGGGGAGSGASPNTVPGSAGGTTTFGTSLLSCTGGGGGVYGGSGSGGSPTGGGSNGVSISGGDGGIPSWTQPSTYIAGANGGSSALGGAGAGSWLGNAGVAGKTNTGGGGGGAGVSAVSAYANSGGGAGAYIRTIITSPSATYSYAVGAGGTAGAASTNGYAGGAGGSGLIVVTAYF